jgi:hypothetical protein
MAMKHLTNMLSYQYEVLNWKKNFRRKWYYKLEKYWKPLNADNNLVFKPADQTNYLTTAFGLTSLFLHW